MRKRRVLIRAVQVVTAEHGETFAREWFDASWASLEVVGAITATGIMAWPLEDADAQVAYNDIEDEILERTFEAVKPYLAEAFVKVANAVFDRERRRPVLTAGK